MRVPHRRSFLKHTLAAGAAAALLPTTRVLGANDDVRVAVVGLRSQGKAHLRNYLNMQGVRVVALCDVDQAILDAEVQRLALRGQKVQAFPLPVAGAPTAWRTTSCPRGLLSQQL